MRKSSPNVEIMAFFNACVRLHIWRGTLNYSLEYMYYVIIPYGQNAAVQQQDFIYMTILTMGVKLEISR